MAAIAALATEEHLVLAHPERLPHPRVNRLALDAATAVSPHQPLRQHGHETGVDQIRFDADFEKPGHSAGSIIGMQRRQHQVSGEGALYRHLRRLEIADLADHDHVRIVTENMPQRAREGESGRVVHLNLIDPGQPILDRILDGDDVDAAASHLLQSRV